MKKLIAFIISIILVVGIVLFTLNKIGVFNGESGISFNINNKQVKYDKPEINKDHIFIKEETNKYELNNINQEILVYYYYDEIDNSTYNYNEETETETIIEKNTAYYLIREFYINGDKVGETAKIEYQNDKNFNEAIEKDFNSIKYNTLKDKENKKEYLVISLTDNIITSGITNVKTNATYIVNDKHKIIYELQNGNNTGFVNIPIYKDELNDRSYLNGISSFNKLFDTNYDYLLYSENGYVDVLKNKIYYIDVNASKCEIDEYEIIISNGEVLNSYVKTYPDVSKYVTGEGYC